MLRSSPDWRIWLGLSVTIAWLVLGSIYVSANIGWVNFDRIPADELGNFLEGAFAPLAFLWLVIGYFLQQKELQQNTEALRQQSEQMAESVMHARQDTFLQVVRNVRYQLGSISGFLFISSQSIGADGNVTPEEQSRLFAEQSAADPEVFSRRLLEAHLQLSSEEERYRLFYGTEVRARHSNNFIFTFERLMRRAKQVDTDNMIQDALFYNGHGMLYRIAKRHQANAPEALADHRQTGLYLNIS